jgi:hypothetical protein
MSQFSFSIIAERDMRMGYQSAGNELLFDWSKAHELT